MECVFVICVLLHEAKPMDRLWLSLSEKLLSVGRVPGWVGCSVRVMAVLVSSCLNVSVQNYPLKFKDESFFLIGSLCIVGASGGVSVPAPLPLFVSIQICGQLTVHGKHIAAFAGACPYRLRFPNSA